MFFSQHNGSAGGAAGRNTLGFPSAFMNSQPQHHSSSSKFDLDNAIAQMVPEARHSRRSMNQQQGHQAQQKKLPNKQTFGAYTQHHQSSFQHQQRQSSNNLFNQGQQQFPHAQSSDQMQIDPQGRQQHTSAFQNYQSSQQQQPQQQQSRKSRHAQKHPHRMTKGPQQNGFNDSSMSDAPQQLQQYRSQQKNHRQLQPSAFLKKQLTQQLSSFPINKQTQQSQQEEFAQPMEEDMQEQSPSPLTMKPSIPQRVYFQQQQQKTSPFIKKSSTPQQIPLDQQPQSSSFIHFKEPSHLQRVQQQQRPPFQKQSKPVFTLPSADAATALQSPFSEPSQSHMQQRSTPIATTTPVQKKKNALNKASSTRIQSPASSTSLSSANNNNGKVTAADRAKRFGGTAKTSLYEQFKKDRVREREQAIRDGLIPDPENPTRLEDAIDFRGTCEDKCPEFEMIEREIQNGLDALETDDYGNADPDKVVKAYRRSAAGNEQPLPSDVRSPTALVATLDYLIDEVLSNQPLEKCHAFIRDRTRSIRQDFTLQNIRDVTAVHVHERVARFHILCLHEMCEYDESKFSEQQEIEQLRKVLLSLMEFYDDLREEGIETENEAEFRAYHLITHIRDQDLMRQAQTLPIHVFKHPYMKRALEFHALAQRNNEIMETSSRKNKFLNVEASQNNYTGFFKLIADKDTPFLMACLLECHFADIRKGALKAMNLSYMIKAGGVEAEDVRRVLAYDTMSHLLEEAALYGLVIDMSLGEPTICFGQKHYRTKTAVFKEPLSNPSQKKSLSLVEPKKGGRTFKQIINGDAFNNINTTPRTSLQLSNMFVQYNSEQRPVEIKVKFTDLTGSPPKRIGKTVSTNNNQQSTKNEKEELERLKNQVQSMEAEVEREKQRMAELVKVREEQMRLRKEQEEKVKVEEERQRQEQLQRKAAAAAAAAAAEEEEEKERKEREISEEQQRKAAAMQEELQQQAAKDEMIASLRRKAIVSKTVNHLRNTFIENFIADAARQRLQKILRTRQLIRWRMRSKLADVRERISKRKIKISQWRRQWELDHKSSFVLKNPYSALPKQLAKSKCLQLTSTEIQQRVEHCLEAEEIAVELYEAKPNKNSEEHMASVWQTEKFAFNNIYPRINDKFERYKQQLQTITGTTTEDNVRINWELLIHVADTRLESSGWFKRKFGLDNTTLQRCDRYVTCDITLKMMTPVTELYEIQALHTKAIIFSLPEHESHKKSCSEIEDYWTINRIQLKALLDKLDQYHPGVKLPIVFTFFPDNTPIEQIPYLLDLNNSDKISDWHILLMNPLTIPQRICEEVNWLAKKA
ncbi:SAC3/GANP/Nin1/mts3/eIF-3 p25 family-domain-containing protein [Mycotypha africana]|uniref:SAC3/GANP/Nin1/mts3/eIF-3 p25 family-domain-containing protein n=1 Tax=Mycotypha africana TaxID=64632 RepID=UPI002300C36C|nr:SAC3/GANP/Nin1/mts3/eIF-3 p25 family-domain-containing protein [Mycotypha africana]KAI8975135.1 SAC3/GANP/Nin1/mts3/eIF-3 p25 family-domain-containing protein [Mycotypha africana]